MRETDDVDAIRRCQRGEIDGLTTLIRRYEREGLRLAWLLTGDRFLAEDITQDSFLQAYRAIGRFQADRPFAPWFLQIVTNTTRMRQRAAKRRREISLDALVSEAKTGQQAPGRPALRLLTPAPAAEVAADPTTQAERMEQRAALALALAALTQKQREAVVLRYYFGYDDSEIADILGCRIGAARRRIYDGLRALERIIRRRFPWLLGDAQNMSASLPTTPPRASTAPTTPQPIPPTQEELRYEAF